MSSVAELLAAGHNQTNAQRIATAIINRQYPIQELIDLFYSGDTRICQYSALPMELIAKQEPSLLYPYLDKMLAALDDPKSINGIFRNTFRTWQFMPIPESHQGEILDKAFQYFQDHQQAIAIRVFAMTVCTNLAETFPELAPEIITIIEDNWDHTTAAWRGRGKRELKRLNKLIR